MGGKRRTQGDGSIYQRPDGSWVAQLDLGYVDGKRKRPVRRAATKREAQAKLDDMKRARDAGAVPTAAKVDWWLTRWLEDVMRPRRDAGDIKAATYRRAESAVEVWLAPQLGRVRLDRLGPQHVRALHATMRAAGLSETSVRNAHAILRQAIRQAVADGLLPRDPIASVHAPTPKRTHPTLTAGQAGLVMAAAASDPRALARVHVALLAGLRQGEALALRWRDYTGTHLQVRTSIARVDGELVHVPPKTAAGVRDVPVAPALAVSLDAWRAASGAGPNDYIFHGYRGPQAPEGAERDYRAWVSVVKDAGVPHVPPHGARGTCATLLQDAGVPPRVVADILGQSEVRVMLDHYSHSDDDARRRALLALDAQLAP